MTTDRRTLLKYAGLSGLGAATASGGRAGAAQPMLAGLTCATIVGPAGTGLGVRTPHGVLDVAGVERAAPAGLPRSVDDLIQGRGDRSALARLLRAPPRRHLLAEDGLRFGPCVGAPEKIICLGLNYHSHVAETGLRTPKQPLLFNKYNSSLNAHGGVIRVSTEDARNWDYEAEMVIVMGRQARDVSEAAALDYVFGYCTGQDFTARDLQMLNGQWMIGKCGDGWGPIGPWLVSADQVDPDNLDIQCLINGEVRQSSNTRNMIFNCRQMISYISHHMTLKPGDLIFTGTPEGVIGGYPKDKQVWLKPGDRIVSVVEKLGRQEVTLT